MIEGQIALSAAVTGDTPASEARGLTSSEAEKRLETFGPNDPAPPTRQHPFLQLLALFANPLVIILLIAAFLSALLGDAPNATIIVFVVLIGVGINFAQTYRSQRAAERLSEKVAPTATVLRDGSWRELSRRDVVPGDVVRLSAGDLVPGDARLLAARDLHVQEAALTGESMPTEKEAETAVGTRENRGAVFLGTSVVSGTATAVITATGPRDEIRGHRDSPTRPASGDRIRPRRPPLQRSHSARCPLPRPLHRPCERCTPAPGVRVAPLRRRTGRRAHP